MNIKSILLASLLILCGTGPAAKSYKSANQNLVQNDNEVIVIKQTSNYQVGDIDLGVTDKDYIYSPFNIKFSKRISKPNLRLSLSYINKNNVEVFIYDWIEAGYRMDHNYKIFFGEIKIPLDQLADEAIFKVKTCMYNVSRPTPTEFQFKITNPLFTQKLELNKEKRIYTGFSKSFSSTFGRNYFKSYLVSNSHSENYYYYNHYNFGKFLKATSNNAYGITESLIYIYDPKTTLFKDATITKNEYPNHHFFTLLATQDSTGEVSNFVFGKQYYLNPVTNIMSETKSPGFIEADNSIYLPLQNFADFKTTRFGILFDIEAYLTTYHLICDFTLNFEEHYYKNDFVIYKEIIKTTKDPDMEKITL